MRGKGEKKSGNRNRESTSYVITGELSGQVWLELSQITQPAAGSINKLNKWVDIALQLVLPLNLNPKRFVE